MLLSIPYPGSTTHWTKLRPVSEFKGLFFSVIILLAIIQRIYAKNYQKYLKIQENDNIKITQNAEKTDPNQQICQRCDSLYSNADIFCSICGAKVNLNSNQSSKDSNSL